jgi:hypothetical protein
MPAPRVAFAIVDFSPNTLTNISVIKMPPTGSHALKTWKNAGGFVRKKWCFAPQVFLVCLSTSVVQVTKSNSPRARACRGYALLLQLPAARRRAARPGFSLRTHPRTRREWFSYLLLDSTTLTRNTLCFFRATPAENSLFCAAGIYCFSRTHYLFRSGLANLNSR